MTFNGAVQEGKKLIKAKYKRSIKRTKASFIKLFTLNEAKEFRLGCKIRFMPENRTLITRLASVYFRSSVPCGRHVFGKPHVCPVVSYFGLVGFQDSNNHSRDGTCCSVHLWGTQAHTRGLQYPEPTAIPVGVLCSLTVWAYCRLPSSLSYRMWRRLLW